MAPASEQDVAQATAQRHGNKTREDKIELVSRELSSPRNQDDFDPAGKPSLSPSVLRVSRIADRNGDRRFVMVDKVHGKLILFENGKPAIIRPALTGESEADLLPPDARSRPLSQQIGVQYKVTPAGRFTLTKGYDDTLGATLDVNELQGKDWVIAIHRIPSGNRSQHRDARLRSASDADKHITEGCIDVEPGTVEQLLRSLPKAGRTPIYILPTDENLITKMF